jgi:hypothetical protein
MEERGIATGLLLAVFGLWLILRTVNSDSSGRTLVDRITGGHPAVAK